MRHNTPVEEYPLDKHTVYVKREDLVCPVSRFSKVRGIMRWVRETEASLYCCVDTWRSRNGLGLAACCVELGYPSALIFRPESIQREAVEICEEIQRYRGRVITIPKTTPGFPMQHVLEHWAREYLKDMSCPTVLMPRAAKLPQTVDEVRKVTLETLTEYPQIRTIIVPVGTGTHLAGVIRGAPAHNIIGVLGYTHDHRTLERYLAKMGAPPYANVHLADPGYAYSDLFEEPMPFPASKYYETKAWRWLRENITDISHPILFWNVGAI